MVGRFTHEKAKCNLKTDIIGLLDIIISQFEISDASKGLQRECILLVELEAYIIRLKIYGIIVLLKTSSQKIIENSISSKFKKHYFE